MRQRVTNSRGLSVVIGEKRKVLRVQKNISEDDIEERTGPLRCHLYSRPRTQATDYLMRCIHVRAEVVSGFTGPQASAPGLALRAYS
jgi:hypothetical protein